MHKAVYRGVVDKKDVEVVLEVPFKEHTYMLPAFQVMVDPTNSDTRTNSVIFRYSHSLTDQATYEKNVDREGHTWTKPTDAGPLVPRFNDGSAGVHVDGNGQYSDGVMRVDWNDPR